MSVRYNSEMSHAFSAAASATTPQTLIAAGQANQRTLVYAAIFTLSVTGTVQLQDTQGNNISSPLQMTAGVPGVFDLFNNLDPRWETGLGVGVQAVITGGGTLAFDAWYLQH